MSFGLTTIKARLVAALTALALGAIFIGALGLSGMSDVIESMEDVNANRLGPTGWLGEINATQRDIQQLLTKASIVRTAEATAETRQFIESRRPRVAELWQKYQATTFTEEERQLADAFWNERSQVIAMNDRIMAALTAGQYDVAQQLSLYESPRVFAPMINTADRLLALQVRVAGEVLDDARGLFSRDRSIIMLTIAAALVAAIVLGTLLVRAVIGGMQAASRVAEQIARGQLNASLPQIDNNEIGTMLRALQTMDRTLAETVTAVRAAAENVGGAATQLSQGNDDLSHRTQEQAAALEETSSSMEEMTATVKQNADNAKQANELAAGARVQAEQGGEVVTRAVAAMQEINESSSRIAAIIGVIDEIAFQTNLLALNAAVEAARAGEQGRGFAVVATEVRALAQRSAGAAKEIKGLIGDSVGKVRIGAELVDQSGQVLTGIVDSVKKVSDIVAEIAAASHEQAAGIDQVNRAVNQMDQTTQQNAALVEEASAAAKSMEQQAQDLLSRISYFQTGTAAAVAAPKLAPPPAVMKRPPASVAARALKPVQVRPVARKVSGDSTVWQEF